MRLATILAALLTTAWYADGLAAQARPTTGPVIESAGPVFEVADPSFATPLDLTYKVVFEVADSGPRDRMSAQLVTVARYLNMHAQAGVPRDRVRAAAVVHGTAGKSLLSHDAYRAEFGTDNPNAALIEELLEAGVEVVLCGQTAGARGIDRNALLPGVTVSLSAMTALFAFQEQGYRVNLW